MPLSERLAELRDRLQHLVAGGNHVGIHFVRTLRGNQFGDLRNDVHVGPFQRALFDQPEIISVRVADDRGRRSRCLQKEIIADGFKSGRIDEIGKLKLPCGSVRTAASLI